MIVPAFDWSTSATFLNVASTCMSNYDGQNLREPRYPDELARNATVCKARIPDPGRRPTTAVREARMRRNRVDGDLIGPPRTAGAPRERSSMSLCLRMNRKRALFEDLDADMTTHQQ